MQTATQILAKVEAGRLAKAVEGLSDGSYHVYVTEQDSEHVRGSVINGDGKEYGCSIGDGYVSCQCKDFWYRQTTCKHVLAMALQVLRAEEAVENEPEERPGWQA